jgi:hypothetical protein
MATIRKSFNLRNGVQVDNDNFIVTANGRVGIGTSTPTELFDVYGGTIKSDSGIIANNITTVNSQTTGISTENRLNVNSHINVGITSITSGIITATSGVVTYYGDGGRLLNLPTSQWLDVDVGLGFTSIYAQGYVGVGTVDPRHLFQVGGNNNLGVFTNGVGIDGFGNIKATGIITASQFSGSGSLLTNINATNISSGTISNSFLPSNINLSGIITAQNYFSGNLVGIANTANDVSSTSSITLTGLKVTGISTADTIFNVTGSIGVGNLTTNADIHVTRSGISSLRLTSNGSFPSIITLGRSGTSSFSNNGQIRYGNTDTNFSRSTEQSLDVINFGNGNTNFYNNSGVVGPSGNYYWHSGSSISRMILTADGKLGLGQNLEPINLVNQFHVVGTSTVTSNSFVGASLFVNTNATIGGSLSANQLSVPNLTVTQTSVGIATNSTSYTLQIGSSPLVSGGGVGIGSDGFVRIRNDIATVRNINSSGIVTSTELDVNGNGDFSGSLSVGASITSNASYSGNFYGNGSNITNLDLNNVTNGSISGSRIDQNSNINVTGIITASNLDVSTIELDSIIIESGTNPGFPTETTSMSMFYKTNTKQLIFFVDDPVSGIVSTSLTLS